MNLTELQALEERYLMRTYKRAPVEFVRGDGALLWDAEGREYLGGRAQRVGEQQRHLDIVQRRANGGGAVEND